MDTSTDDVALWLSEGVSCGVRLVFEGVSCGVVCKDVDYMGADSTYVIDTDTDIR